MTRTEFLTIAIKNTILPDILLEDENIRKMLRRNCTKEELQNYIKNNY